MTCCCSSWFLLSVNSRLVVLFGILAGVDVDERQQRITTNHLHQIVQAHHGWIRRTLTHDQRAQLFRQRRLHFQTRHAQLALRSNHLLVQARQLDQLIAHLSQKVLRTSRQRLPLRNVGEVFAQETVGVFTSVGHGEDSFVRVFRFWQVAKH